jgi:hypothetical protein
MNKARRQELYDVTSFLDDAIGRLEEIKDDEEDAFNSMPEGFQNSSRGDKMQVVMSMLDGFIGRIENLKGAMENMIKEK